MKAFLELLAYKLKRDWRDTVGPLDVLADVRSRLRSCAERCQRKMLTAAIAEDSYKSYRSRMPASLASMADRLLAAHQHNLKEVFETILVADKIARGLIVLYTADQKAANADIEVYATYRLLLDVPVDLARRLEAIKLDLFRAVVSFAR